MLGENIEAVSYCQTKIYEINILCCYFLEIRLSTPLLRSSNNLRSGIWKAYKNTRRSEPERLPPLSGCDVLIIVFTRYSLSTKHDNPYKSNAKEEDNWF